MIKIEHNVTTGEIIEIEMTEDEIAAAQLEADNLTAKLNQEAAKVSAKADLYERLGITEDEAKLLLS